MRFTPIADPVVSARPPIHLRRLLATAAVLAIVHPLLAGSASAEDGPALPAAAPAIERIEARDAAAPSRGEDDGGSTDARPAEVADDASHAPGQPTEKVPEQPEKSVGSSATAEPRTAPLPEESSAQGEAATPEPALVPVDTERAPSIGTEEPREQPAAGALPHDLSPWGMYQAADIVVKAVMIGLAIASFITWTVWVAKATELWAAKRRLKRAIRRIGAAQSLSEAIEAFARTGGAGAVLVREAGEEMARSLPVLDHGDGQGIKERVTSRLSRIEANAGRRMTLGTGVLATIGATAPFVGLFGTVWGIMNSFIGISQSQTTNLAVVAPGIAEALLATALGLVAAIPAVIIYNVFARAIAGYRLLLADASAGVERLVSWELDARRLPAGTRLAQAAE